MDKPSTRPLLSLLCYFCQSELHLNAIVQSQQCYRAMFSFSAKIRVLRAQTQEGQVDRVENREKSLLFRLVGDSVTGLEHLEHSGCTLREEGSRDRYGLGVEQTGTEAVSLFELPGE